MSGIKNQNFSETTIGDFFKIDNEKRERLKKKVYEKYYQNCISEMKRSKRMGKDYYEFSVPRQILTEPDYNYIECIVHIQKRLKNAGFEQVKIFRPNIIFVSWVNENVEKEKIKDLCYFYSESKKNPNDVIKAPSIMWNNTKKIKQLTYE